MCRASDPQFLYIYVSGAVSLAPQLCQNWSKGEGGVCELSIRRDLDFACTLFFSKNQVDFDFFGIECKFITFAY